MLNWKRLVIVLLHVVAIRATGDEPKAVPWTPAIALERHQFGAGRVVVYPNARVEVELPKAMKEIVNDNVPQDKATLLWIDGEFMGIASSKAIQWRVGDDYYGCVIAAESSEQFRIDEKTTMFIVNVAVAYRDRKDAVWQSLDCECTLLLQTTGKSDEFHHKYQYFARWSPLIVSDTETPREVLDSLSRP